MNKKKFFAAATIVLITLIFVSCERNTDRSGVVSIQLPVYLTNEVITYSEGQAPSSASEIDCFGFLVSHSDVNADRAVCELKNGATGEFSRKIRGRKVVGGFYAGDSAEFEVDAGPNRVLHVIGFKTNMPSNAATTRIACRDVLKSDSDSFSKPFLIGTSQPFNVTSGSTQSISVTNSYVPNSTEFFGDCEGPGAPGGGGDEQAGPPVKAVLRLQDNITSVYQDSCVGAAIELYDANGLRARANQNLNFTVTIGGSGSKVYDDGNFCENDLNTDTGVFAFARDNYGQKVFFVKFGMISNWALTFIEQNGLITEIANPPTISVLTFTSVTAAGNAPLKYSIFDVHSFKSTFSSSPTNPINVKAGECRPALVQVVDAFGRPSKAFNPGAPGETSTLVENSTTALPIALDSISSTCTSASQPPTNISAPGSLPSGFAMFRYQVPAGTTNQNFQLKVTNVGTGYLGASGDINVLDPSAANAQFRKSFWFVKD